MDNAHPDLMERSTYLHIQLEHLYGMFVEHSTLYPFLQEGVEHCNKIHKRIYTQLTFGHSMEELIQYQTLFF